MTHQYLNIAIFLMIINITCAIQLIGQRHGRIVGGNVIKIEDAPFIVALEYGRRHICGGALLTERWAVTAAHCFGLHFSPERGVVRVGSSYRGLGGTEHTILRILKHPLFSFAAADNDVGTIQLESAVKLSMRAQIIKLPEPSTRPQVGDLTTVYGWGYTKETGEPSEFLRAVTLPIFPHDECLVLYNSTKHITSKMLCAGYRDGGRDACVLDSGGPLVWHGSLHGLVSWGWGCARALRPGVYTDLAEPIIRDWLSTVTQT